MKKIMAFMLVVLFNTAYGNVTTDQAKQFIDKLITEGIVYWKDKPFDQQVDKFKEVMETKFDLDGIARRVLGDRLWTHMSPAQKEQYLKAFRRMLLSRYSKKFTQYGGERITVIDASTSVKKFTMGANATVESPQIVVTSELYHSGSAPVKVEWYVGEWSGRLIITDITLAGPSMVATEQSTFTAIQRNPETLHKARDACKGNANPNKCIAGILLERVMTYMAAAD